MKAKNESGVILIITLIIMAILLSTAIGFGAFIISDLRQAGQIDDSLAAYHAAEAGLERQLFYLRHFEDIKTVADLKAILDNGDNAESPVSLGEAAWQIAESQDYEPVFYRQRLENGENAKFYILGRAGANRTNLTEAIQINWKKGFDVNGEPLTGTKIQVSFTQLESQTYNDEVDGEDNPIVVFYTDKSEVINDNTDQDKNCLKLADGCVDDNNCDSSNHDYAVEIKALGSGADYLEQLSVRTYGDEACAAGTEVSNGITNVTLKSTGLYSGARQQIVAQIPPKSAVSGLLGFVLFSEEDITKGY